MLVSVDFTRMNVESPSADGGGVSNDRARLDLELVPEDCDETDRAGGLNGERAGTAGRRGGG